MVTYGIDNNGSVYLTGARYSGIASELIRNQFRAQYSSMDAIDISLAHAFFECDAENDDWGYFTSHLSIELRERAITLGMLV